MHNDTGFGTYFYSVGTNYGEPALNCLWPRWSILSFLTLLRWQRIWERKNQSESTGKVEIRTRKKFLAVMKHARLYSDLLQSLKGQHSSEEGTDQGESVYGRFTTTLQRTQKTVGAKACPWESVKRGFRAKQTTVTRCWKSFTSDWG